MVKPFENYFGGKEGSGVYQAIINQIPPHWLYAELFVGNGAIYRRKKAATMSILADLDTEVVEQWEALGVDNREYFDMMCLSIHPGGTNIYNQSAIEILSQTDYVDGFEIGYELDMEGVFIYLDPPYPFSVRKDQTPVYKYEMTDAQHLALLEVISSYKKAMIMISSYPNQMYDDALANWRHKDFTGVTRQGPVTERIWMNYAEPTKLHDYSYYGKDYRERWNVTKSVRNIVNKFKKMSPLMRNVVLEAVISECKSFDDNASTVVIGSQSKVQESNA